MLKTKKSKNRGWTRIINFQNLEYDSIKLLCQIRFAGKLAAIEYCDSNDLYESIKQIIQEATNEALEK